MPESPLTIELSATLTTCCGAPIRPIQRQTICRLACLVLLLGGTIFATGTSAAAQEPETLTVVTTEIEPFVIRDGDFADGFYIEIWEDVASALGVQYELIWEDSFPDMLERVADGTADVAVAPLAATAEREPRFDFTSAVVSSGPQLGVHERTESRASLVRTLLGSGALKVLLTAGLGLVILGHVIWLVERNDDEGFSDFHSSYPRGAWDGIWWAAVTVTTVGYGDTAPRSWRGRLVAMIAMVASLFLVAALVSQVTSDFADRRSDLALTSFADLDDEPVGVLEGSSFARFLEDAGVTTVGLPTQAAVFAAAAEGTIDIVVANPFALATIGAENGIQPVGACSTRSSRRSDSPRVLPCVNRSTKRWQTFSRRAGSSESSDRWIGS